MNHIHATTNYLSGTNAAGEFAFNSQNTGLALADFLLGKPSQFQQQTLVGWYPREGYIGTYVQDTWKATPKLTVNYGLNRVRFPSPVRAGQRIRAHFSPASVEDVASGVQLTWSVTIEVEVVDRAQ